MRSRPTLSMQTTRLAQEEFLALLSVGPVVNITGREAEFHPDGVIDVEPYVRAVPAHDLEGFTCHEQLLVEVVYQTHDGRFDLVNVMTCRANVLLVIVIDNRSAGIHGHLLLDLNREYGLDAVDDA
jgi:hypothetical protein